MKKKREERERKRRGHRGLAWSWINLARKEEEDDNGGGADDADRREEEKVPLPPTPLQHGYGLPCKGQFDPSLTEKMGACC